jgi:site-specific DNA-cytosine methylase
MKVENWYPRPYTCEVGQKLNPHCHPDDLRCLSVEEFAAIQTLPPAFCFAGSSRGQKYSQIGNAVPVKFAQAMAEHLVNHMARQDAVEVREA